METANIKVGARVRPTEAYEASKGLPEGIQGTVMSVFEGLVETLADVVRNLYPVEVKWDGFSYDEFWYTNPNTGEPMFDRASFEELEVIE